MNKKKLDFKLRQARELAFLKSANLKELEKVGCKIEQTEYSRGSYNNRTVQKYVQLFD